SPTDTSRSTGPGRIHSPRQPRRCSSRSNRGSGRAHAGTFLSDSEGEEISMSDVPSAGSAGPDASSQDLPSGDSGTDTWNASRTRAAPPPAGGFGAPTAPPLERLRIAYQRRNDTDYIANFWSALGWG